MKSRLAVLCAVLCLCAGILTAGCGSAPNVTVTINSPTGPQTVEAGQTVNITASASSSDGSNVSSVTWSLTGVGCAGSACGTLTSETGTSAAYEAPPTPPSANITVYVVATAATGAPKSASIAITVEAISVQIQSKVTEIAAATESYAWGARFSAVVKNDPTDAGVNWTLTANGAACSPTCGTLSGANPYSVEYLPPATVPAVPNNTPTITASSMSSPATSDMDTFTVFDGATACAPGGNESLLKGEYAIMLQGWTGNGTSLPLLFGGSFGADGTGKITGGTDQFNPFVKMSYSGASILPSASSYSVGPDNRGCLVLTDQSNNTFTLQFSLGSVNGGTASKGDIILTNRQSVTPEYASGILRLQDPSAFSLNALASNYAFGIVGWENATGVLGHFSAAGAFAQSAGNMLNASFDVNDGGSLITAAGPVGGFGTIEEPVATETGATYAQLQIGVRSLQTANVTIYVINSSELFIISNDLSPTAVISGRAIATTGSLTPASIAPSYIFRSTGSSAGVASASIGRLNFSGGGATGTVSGNIDSYAVGTTGNQSVTGSYAFTPASGRLAVTGTNSAASPICYLTNPFDDAAAFCISTDSTASLGIMDVQPAATYGNTSLTGNFFFGSGEPGDDGVPDISGIAAISSGTLTGTEDTSSSSGLSLSAVINAALSINSDGTGTMGPNTVLVTNGTEMYLINEANGAPAEVQVFQQ
ncbi:MAG TPA: Ig-like domain-containing protein [Candidatus Acidoferrum sp.]|nr:Ig-like domain-containing protein [Candidatus Acidoferrum sp.]